MFVAEFQEDVPISTIAEHLKDSDMYVRKTVIEGVSMLAAQGMC